MRVAYDNVIFGLQRSGGISVYWGELLRRADPSDSSIIDPTNADRNPTWRATASRFPDRRRSRVPVQVDRYLPVLTVPRSAQVFHSSYYRVAAGALPAVVTVYDFVYERFRAGLPRLAHSAQKRAAVRGAGRVICISESARRDLLERYGSGLDHRTSVVHLGVGEQFRPVADARAQLTGERPFLRTGRPFLLFVGSRRHYKGFDAAVETVAMLPGYDLVAVGGEAWGPEDDALAARYRCADRVHAVGPVPGPDLPLWYGAAHALLYLSAYEGFGLPVLEAAMCDCPVVARNTSAIPEVHGFHDLLLDVPVAGEIAARLRALESDTYRARAARATREHASRFSWTRCWDETQRVYELL